MTEPYVAPLAGPEPIPDPAGVGPAGDLDPCDLPVPDPDEFSPVQPVEPLTDDGQVPS